MQSCRSFQSEIFAIRRESLEQYQFAVPCGEAEFLSGGRSILPANPELILDNNSPRLIVPDGASIHIVLLIDIATKIRSSI
jgi:hypothetical protein